MRSLLGLATFSMIVLLSADLAAESGRIYGQIHTVDNEIYEGWIRWDKNEAFWDDPIDGVVAKERYSDKSTKGRRHKERKVRKPVIEFFGIRIGESSSYWGRDEGSSSQLEFGNIKTIFFEGDDEARVVLKNDNEILFTSGADIGRSIRELLVRDPKEGDIYFDWDDVRKIDLMKEKREPDDGLKRLYGRVSTRRAGVFEGWVEWDVDEVFDQDILDGTEEGGRKRKIPFGRIQSIERRSSSSATVTLTDGKEMVLRNSNDVNSENRGIVVKSRDFGKIKIDWSNFEKVDFLDPPRGLLPRYDDFDGGRRIRGVVTTEYDESFEGEIAWDNDEEWTWEHLNGTYKGVKMDIAFSLIASIEKSSPRSATVTLKSGSTFLLSGSNDVDESNRGIFVLRNKDVVEQVDWYDFQKLVLK